MNDCPYCEQETERRVRRVRSADTGRPVWRCQNHDCAASEAGWIGADRNEVELREYLPLAIERSRAYRDSLGKGITPRLKTATDALVRHWIKWGYQVPGGVK